MKKVLILSLSALLVMSSCGSYEASGAYAGAHFGSIVGSVIGGISGGWRGSDVGSLVGMAGGAMVGAAIGKAADEKAEAKAVERYERHRQANAARNQNYGYNNQNYGSNDDSGFDPQGRGDDRIVIDGMSSDYAPTPVKLEMGNIRIVDASHDGVLLRGESAHVVFEIHNPSEYPAFGVQPTVMEVTGNRHIHISENVLVECIPPKQTIRYTAQVKADKGLRNGEAVIRVSVIQAGREQKSLTRDYRLVTRKR